MNLIQSKINSGDCTGYWDFRSGTYRDFSNNGNDGSLISNPVLTNDGLFNPKLTGGFVSINDCTLFDSSNVGTLFILVRQQGETPTTNSFCRFASDGGSSLFFGLYPTSPSRIYMFDGTGGSAITNTFDPILNRSFAATFGNGEKPDGYIDGQYWDDGNNTLSFDLSGNGDLSIGSSNPVSASNLADSIIQAIVVFKEKLTSTEIFQLHDELLKKKWTSKSITNTTSSCLIDKGPTGLVSAYDFRNGDLYDLVGSSHGVQVGSLDFSKERVGTFLTGYGQGHVNLGSWDTSSGSFFMSFYYKHATGTGTRYLTGLWQGASDSYDLLLSGNTLTIYDDINNANTNRYSTGSILVPGQIYHIVYGIDSSNVCKLWINGIPSDNDESAAASVSTLSASISLLTIGGDSSLRIPGSIGNIEFFDTDLTDDDVTSIYSRSINISSIFDGGVIASERSFSTVGDFIENTPFQLLAGNVSVNSETINGCVSKVIDRGTATDYAISPVGEFGINQKQSAYGTWQCTLKYSGSAQVRYHFVENGVNLSVPTGYDIRANGGQIRLSCSVTGTLLTYSTGVSADTWYNVRVTRNYKNEFKMWVKEPSSESWTYVGAATDSTFNSAESFGFLHQIADCSLVVSSDHDDCNLWYSTQVMEP
jgi:hypothetical protein